MKVLITGATGLLGGHLLQELQQRGEQIRVLVLPVENAEKLIAQGVEVVRGDVTDASTLAPAVRDIEIIFHLAGMMGVDRPLADYRLVNVTGSENLYRAAQAAGVSPVTPCTPVVLTCTKRRNRVCPWHTLSRMRVPSTCVWR